MNPPLKFIILRDPDGEEMPIMFPWSWEHRSVAASLAFPDQTVSSAGLVRLEQGKIICFAGSTSLGLECRNEEDEAIIAKWLSGDDDCIFVNYSALILP